MYRVTYAGGEGGYISESYPDADEEYGDSVVAIRLEDATMDELVSYMDEELESANMHSQVGAYEKLAGILVSQVGALSALKVIRAVYRAGGIIDI